MEQHLIDPNFERTPYHALTAYRRSKTSYAGNWVTG